MLSSAACCLASSAVIMCYDVYLQVCEYCSDMQGLRHLAVNVRWEQESSSDVAVLEAACPMESGAILTHEALLQGSDIESILLDWGPACVSALFSGLTDHQPAISSSVMSALVLSHAGNVIASSRAANE